LLHAVICSDKTGTLTTNQMSTVQLTAVDSNTKVSSGSACLTSTNTCSHLPMVCKVVQVRPAFTFAAG